MTPDVERVMKTMEHTAPDPIKVLLHPIIPDQIVIKRKETNERCMEETISRTEE